MTTCELFSSTLSKLQPPINPSPSPHTKGFTFRKKPSATVHALANPLNRTHRPPAITIGKSPEPPWPVPQPTPLENPFSCQQLLPPRISGAGIPFSLRLVQMKKRRSFPASPLSLELSSQGNPVTKAVAALLFMMQELQRPVLENDEGGGDGPTVAGEVPRDMRDCFLWLFGRVFPNSPNIVPLVLLLFASFIAASTEEIARRSQELSSKHHVVSKTKTQEKDATDEASPAAVVAFAGDNLVDGSAFEIFDTCLEVGIKKGATKSTKASEDRLRRVYESAIARGEFNSLILSNYAQFLYKIAQDHDRAEHYFKLAAKAEPKDADAISKYAHFVWKERGDMTRAEKLFLKAIDVDPGSFYHCSNYASFLWKTGAEDTCFPLSPSTSK